MPQPSFSIADHFHSEWDEDVFTAWLSDLRARLDAPYVSLGMLFLAPRFFPHALRIQEIIRIEAGVPMLVGCSSTGLVCGDGEKERGGGLVLHLFALPGAGFAPIRFTQEDIESRADPRNWRDRVFVGRGDSTGFLAFADPYSVDTEAWLAQWNAAWPGTPMGGGLAAGDHAARHVQLYLNGRVYENGGVAVALSGRVGLRVVVSQGCTPIGETWTVTRARGQLIEQIGNRPAFQVLRETMESLSDEDRTRLDGQPLAGIVVNSYSEDYRRGDFLIRPVVGADPESGALAVQAQPRVGQALRFQMRDAAGATEDMETVLGSTAATIEGRIYGGCLATCLGRGEDLFGVPDHDAKLVRRFFGGELPLSGFFGNGELGPVARRNHLHTFTAALALLVEIP